MRKIQHGWKSFRGREHRKQQWAGSRMEGWREAHVYSLLQSWKTGWPPLLLQQPQHRAEEALLPSDTFLGRAPSKAGDFCAQIAFPIKKVSLIISQQTASLCSSPNITEETEGLAVRPAQGIPISSMLSLNCSSPSTSAEHEGETGNHQTPAVPQESPNTP